MVHDDSGGKRGLVLSGGGANGAWQLGVLRHLLADEARRYDVVAGVSVGALNGSVLAMHRPGDEAAAYRELAAIWEGVGPAAIRRRRFPFGALHALWRPSIYDTTPLRTLVARHLEPARVRVSGRALSVGAVSLDDGGYAWFDGHDPHIVDAVIASSAFPIFFEPQVVGGTGAWWTDGGVRNIAPLAEAIDLGCDLIDVVVCAATSGPWTVAPRRRNALRVALRTLDIVLDEVLADDLVRCHEVNRLVAVREALAHSEAALALCQGAGGVTKLAHRHVAVSVYRPASALGDSLDFSRERLAELMRRGYADARAGAITLAQHAQERAGRRRRARLDPESWRS